MTANNPEGSPIHRMTAGEQFDTGFSTFITEIRERRFPVVDEERELVYAIVFFDHAGTVTSVKLTDGTTMTVPLPYDTPYMYLIGELQDQERQDPSHRSGAPARSLRYALRLGLAARRPSPLRSAASVPGNRS